MSATDILMSNHFPLIESIVERRKVGSMNRYISARTVKKRIEDEEKLRRLK